MRTVGVAVLLAVGLAAPAQAERPKLQREYLAKYAELVDRHGVDEAGCNLLTDTAKWNRCEGKPTRAKLRESTATLERMLYVPPPPQPKASPPVGVQAESVPEVGSAGGGATATASSAGGPEAFVQCESGGSWTAQNPSGAYGRYQLMPLHYGSGGVCAGMGKSPSEQTECANRVYESQGSSAWSQCGG
jgi:hypothetical protein